MRVVSYLTYYRSKRQIMTVMKGLRDERTNILLAARYPPDPTVEEFARQLEIRRIAVEMELDELEKMYPHKGPKWYERLIVNWVEKIIGPMPS